MDVDDENDVGDDDNDSNDSNDDNNDNNDNDDEDNDDNDDSDDSDDDDDEQSRIEERNYDRLSPSSVGPGLGQVSGSGPGPGAQGPASLGASLSIDEGRVFSGIDRSQSVFNSGKLRRRFFLLSSKLWSFRIITLSND